MRRGELRPYPDTPHPIFGPNGSGGCTCGPNQLHAGGDPAVCAYHRAAAENPEDHRIPWNCPTYWDGCNCPANARPAGDAVTFVVIAVSVGLPFLLTRPLYRAADRTMPGLRRRQLDRFVGENEVGE